MRAAEVVLSDHYFYMIQIGTKNGDKKWSVAPDQKDEDKKG